MYFIRTPFIVKKLFPNIIWEFPSNENSIFLTFDDGPHPQNTHFILAQLDKYNAKATFFCLGENAEKHPELILEILDRGHAIGNHGYRHLNGWKISPIDFMENYKKGNEILEHISGSEIKLFRPPYGKIKLSQISDLPSLIVLWSLMPGDFDVTISTEKCYNNAINNLCSGDIICLHDNEKALQHLYYCLPKWLEYIYNKGLKSNRIIL